MERYPRSIGSFGSETGVRSHNNDKLQSIVRLEPTTAANGEKWGQTGQQTKVIVDDTDYNKLSVAKKQFNLSHVTKDMKEEVTEE